MNSERADRIRNLYYRVRAMPFSEREKLLLEEPDSDISSEVRQLFEAEDQRTVIMQPDGASSTKPSSEDERKAFSPGDVLSGRFRILKFISGGGMGEVYAAEDLDLRGKVAIKTIRPDVASDPAMIERFHQEILFSQRITHPNVCRIFDLRVHGSNTSTPVVFLTMELLEGEPLDSRMRRSGPLSTAQATPLVKQILSGLSAAHRVGIIHQDFKPSNVFLVPEENKQVRAVIMDFGLSRHVNVPVQEHDLLASSSPSATELGGTPAYMAPEQLRGEDSSVRSDIYSVGLVLYELITGHKPFTSGAKRLQHLNEVPVSPRKYVPHLDSTWEKAIMHCLAPDPAGRFESVDAIMDVLGWSSALPRRHSRLARFIWVAAPLLIIAVLAFLIESRRTLRIQDLTQLTSSTDLSADPSLSRDGKMVAYESDRGEPGNTDVWVQGLPSGVPKRITSDPAVDDDVNISPDGQRVVFHSDRKPGGIYIAGTAGGPEHLLASPGYRPKFSPDGKEVAYWTGEFDRAIPSGKIFVVSSTGGTPRQLVSGFIDARDPLWSPDGKWIMFSGCRDFHGSLEACRDWWVVSTVDSKVIQTHALTRIRSQRLTVIYYANGWYSDGVLFPASGDGQSEICRLQLSRYDFQASGKAVCFNSGKSNAIDATLAEDGTIAFGQIDAATHIWGIRLPGETSAGEPYRVTSSPALDSSPAISADARYLAFERNSFGRGSTNTRIFLHDLRLDTQRQIAQEMTKATHPILSPDGSQIVFESPVGDVDAMYVAPVDQSPVQVCSRCGNPTGWWQDERAILFTDGATGTIKSLDLASRQSSVVLAPQGHNLGDATWSAASKSLAFTVALDDGDRQIFVAPMPKNGSHGAAKWIPLTPPNEWADKPQWASDGRTVYFASKRDGFECIWGQRYDPNAEQAVGKPFAISHFHNSHSGPDLLSRSNFALAVGGNTLIFNSAEASETIWVGRLSSVLSIF